MVFPILNFVLLIKLSKLNFQKLFSLASRAQSLLVLSLPILKTLCNLPLSVSLSAVWVAQVDLHKLCNRSVSFAKPLPQHLSIFSRSDIQSGLMHMATSVVWGFLSSELMLYFNHTKLAITSYSASKVVYYQCLLYLKETLPKYKNMV